MLGGNLRHMELAYALQFSMPGTPVLRYGEEIGMVEDLRLPARDAIRTPMQWTPEPMAGFTAPDAQGLVRPLVTRGPGSYRKTNVLTEQADPNSLVRWFERLISTLHECPEIGVGDCEFVESTGSLSVLCHRFDAPEGAILMMHNLADTDAVIDVGRVEGMAGTPYEVLADDDYRPPTRRLTDLQLNGWGYRWIRLRRGRGA
jgi:maltose alpha-D-glucosyltransferase/alpha-amylase